MTTNTRGSDRNSSRFHVLHCIQSEATMVNYYSGPLGPYRQGHQTEPALL